MWIGGLDLGQSQDPSALALLERTQTPEGQSSYSVRYLKRWPLGTPYVSPPGQPPGIGEDLRSLLNRPYLQDCPLAVDQTGVGRGVIDAFRLLELPVPLVPITITAGHKATMEPDGSWHVPKRELVACLQVLLGQGRLVVAEALPLASVLVQEMRTFKYKVTAAGNEVTAGWRDRDHDDIILAVALSVFLAERMPTFDADSIGVGTGHSPLADMPAGVFGPGDPRRWPRQM